MRPSPALALPVLAAALLLATACGNDCGPAERCAYPGLLLAVHAPSGAALPDATVSQNGVALSTDLTPIFCPDNKCTHAVTPAVSGRLTVSRPDYQDAFVDYVRRDDMCGRMIRQAVDVGMVETTLSQSPEVSAPQILGTTCN